MTNTEIQVGEYVRTKKHGIFKVTKLYEVEDKYYILNNDKYETYTIGGNPNFDISKDIVNHDFDIIKLIEEGDYVNGGKVFREHTANGEEKLLINFCYTRILLKIVDIKTIVTHEQMKAMEYKVGGENE